VDVSLSRRLGKVALRAFCPFAASAPFGGDVPWTQWPAYVVGPVLGAPVAAVSYDLLARPRAAAGSGAWGRRRGRGERPR
jgi:glycerol uptake facilitator-like aquaporin